MLSSSSSTAADENRNKSLKLMEEVWKDINLASLNEHITRPMMTTTSTFEGVIFQDFLGRPFSIDPLSNTMVSKTSNTTASLFCPPSPAPSPVTALSLSSTRPEFHLDPLRPKGSQMVQQPLQHHPDPAASKSDNCFSITPFDSLVCTSSLPCFGSKRFPEVPPDCNPGERRNKRMIKNRESAARSRARKQAYTKELQLKVDHLLEENARLKRQQEKLCEAAASQQKKKKNSLYRTSTAPF